MFKKLDELTSKLALKLGFEIGYCKRKRIVADMIGNLHTYRYPLLEKYTETYGDGIICELEYDEGAIEIVVSVDFKIVIRVLLCDIDILQNLMVHIFHIDDLYMIEECKKVRTDNLYNFVNNDKDTLIIWGLKYRASNESICIIDKKLVRIYFSKFDDKFDFRYRYDLNEIVDGFKRVQSVSYFKHVFSDICVNNIKNHTLLKSLDTLEEVEKKIVKRLPLNEDGTYFRNYRHEEMELIRAIYSNEISDVNKIHVKDNKVIGLDVTLHNCDSRPKQLIVRVLLNKLMTQFGCTFEKHEDSKFTTTIKFDPNFLSIDNPKYNQLVKVFTEEPKPEELVQAHIDDTFTAQYMKKEGNK